MPHPVTMSAYEESCDLYMGWCSECKDFTTEMCEPDAEDYECHNCGKNTAMGAEDALLRGLICLKEDNADYGVAEQEERETNPLELERK